MKQRMVLPLALGYERRLPERFPKFYGSSPLWREGAGGTKGPGRRFPGRNRTNLIGKTSPPFASEHHHNDGRPLSLPVGSIRVAQRRGRGERYEFIYDEMKRLASDIRGGRIPLIRARRLSTESSSAIPTR